MGQVWSVVLPAQTAAWYGDEIQRVIPSKACAMSDHLLEGTHRRRAAQARRRRRVDRRERAQPRGADRRPRRGAPAAQARRYRHGPASSGSTPSAPGCWSGWCAAFAARGCDTNVTGLKDDYRALMDEAARRQAGGAAGASRQSALPMRIASIGESIVCGRPFASSAIVNMLGALAVALLRVLTRPRTFPLHLDGASARQCRLARGADHPADYVSDRLHHRAAGHVPFPQIRRRHLRGRHGRHPGAARNRRADRLPSWWPAARAAPTPPNSAR